MTLPHQRNVREPATLAGRSGTKPGGLGKHQIPIRTFADWDDTRPGFVEIDLVGHEGGNPRGDFCQTLTMTDVATGWTENMAVRNKARSWATDPTRHRPAAEKAHRPRQRQDHQRSKEVRARRASGHFQ